MTESTSVAEELATPKSLTKRRWWKPRLKRTRAERLSERNAPEKRESKDSFGRLMEAFARGMGTPSFLLWLTIVVAAWLVWNSMAPEDWRFDSAEIGFTALTLILSLQASYAAPMLLLAQNRQDDRDRVQIQQDRQRAERNTADLEYLAREIVALRLLVKDMASKDFIRAELRALLEDIEELDDDDDPDEERDGLIKRERSRVQQAKAQQPPSDREIELEARAARVSRDAASRAAAIRQRRADAAKKETESE